MVIVIFWEQLIKILTSIILQVSFMAGFSRNGFEYNRSSPSTLPIKSIHYHRDPRKFVSLVVSSGCVYQICNPFRFCDIRWEYILDGFFVHFPLGWNYSKQSCSDTVKYEGLYTHVYRIYLFRCHIRSHTNAFASVNGKRNPSCDSGCRSYHLCVFVEPESRVWI